MGKRKMQTRILVVDDHANGAPGVQDVVESLGHAILLAPNATQAVELLTTQPIDLCVLSLALPGEGTRQVMNAIHARKIAIPAVGLIPDPTVKAVVAGYRLGLTDFLPRPFHPPMAAEVLRRALTDRGRSSLGQRTSGATLLGEHPAMNVVLERIHQVADSNASVLVRGEEGTGKEIVARLIAACGERRSAPFVTVRVEPDTHLSSEDLFGASPESPGKIHAAMHGTLFLDEIGNLPRELQVGLLRLLRDPAKRKAADVRIIASSTRPLEFAVREGTFLEDLFYRLNIIPIEIPPLRERPEDIPILVEHFRRAANAYAKREIPPLPPEVLVRLSECPWPGNVRQLEVVVDGLVMAAKDRGVTVYDLPANLRTDVKSLGSAIVDLPPYGVDLRLLLTQLEDRLIGQALERTGGNKLRAAELLGMNRTTLVEKLRRRNVA
jgi:two-component system response regulator AtoC